MHASAWRRVSGRAAMLGVALLTAGLVAAGSASATVFSYSVPMSGQDVIDSGLPAIASATGSASITANDATNQVCGTFSWSGVASPVVFGHIHEGAYGEVENLAYTVNIFGPDFSGAPNPVSSCTTWPNAVIDQMAKYPYMFNVVIHNQQFPGGAIRGQLQSVAFPVQTFECSLPIVGPRVCIK
jgi:hypothetical protein